LLTSSIGLLVLAACGGGSLTVSEYAEAAERLVGEMEERFSSIDAAWEAEVPSIEGARRYWEARLDIRHDFLDGIAALDPPDGVAEMHAAAVDLFSRATAVDEAIAARVADFETIETHWVWNDTPEGRESLALLEDVFAFCRASQTAFDASGGHRETIADMPWLPSDMTERVAVAFGCPPVSEP
jgi:hypothetical protein